MRSPFVLTISVLTTSLACGQDGGIRFNRDVRPILSDNCFVCHGPDKGNRKAELRLDTKAGAQNAFAETGGLTELVRRITHDDPDERMPPPTSHKELSPEQIALLTRWIDGGAEYEEHWANISPARPAVPAARNATWPRNPIDRFVLARLQREGIRPSPAADPITLARRVHFDLTGLPPTPDAVDAFVADPNLEPLVDTLLVSHHHAERMTQYWLDLVRYADTVGYHGDQEHPISPYRDYVLKAFRDNYPFDRFTREQLAGDLLPDATVEQKIASGYNRLLQTTHEGGCQDGEYLVKYAADRVRNVSAVWMGATLGCAECHDHKFDPHPQREFYALAAFFADVEEQGCFAAPNTSPTTRKPELEVLGPFELEELARLDAQIAGCDAADEDRLAHLNERRAAVAKRTRRTMVTVARSTPRTVKVLPRGDWLDDSGDVVTPVVPAAFGALTLDDDRGRPTRLDLANWLVSGSHPRTARVFVNRLWHLFFGRGLAATLDDQGSQGAWPSHPALLDWLACEFVASGWDVRHVVRLIVTSQTYRQSSLPRDDLRTRDPNNALLARQARWRLPAEAVRDAALAISGLLVDQLGGASAHPYQPAGYYAPLNFPQRKYVADTDANQYRRGVYVHWQRQFLHPMLRAFDAPSREECTAERSRSNTPLAALALLNDPSFVEAARAFAQRVLEAGGANDDARIAWAWRQAVTREPSAAEVAVLRGLLDAHRREFARDAQAATALLAVGLSPAPSAGAAELAAWTSLTRTILNLHETITRD